MTGIAELFAELADASRAHYEMQLEMWCLWSRAAGAERLKAWTLANPARARASKAKRQARWRSNRPPEQCYRCTKPHEPGKRACATHLEFDRQRAARKYEAKKAA